MIRRNTTDTYKGTIQLKYDTLNKTEREKPNSNQQLEKYN
jgi:hypothetical protein